MGEPATPNDSKPMDTEQALMAAFHLSVLATASVPGDIPSLIRHAYSRHFNKVLPVERDSEINGASGSTTELESLQVMLSRIPPLKLTAQVLLDRALSILTDGPHLSMNVELTEGQELPVALYTLLQGTLWAILMEAGANPDLEPKPAAFKKSKKQGKAGKKRTPNPVSYAPEARCLWFLCRKFRFCHQVAEKDGNRYTWESLVHRMYMGRLFMIDCNHPMFSRVRMPRALEICSNGNTHIARTPKGMWGWGDNFMSQLGFEPENRRTPVDPTRLTFPACPKVAEYEAILPAWSKHELVTMLSLFGQVTFLVTPVGTVAASIMAGPFVGVGKLGFGNRFGGDLTNQHNFRPVPLPDGFVPDRIIHEERLVVLSMGDRQLIGGENSCGQLGLGHMDGLKTFVDLPFRVDRVMPSEEHNLFMSGKKLLYAGEVTPLYASLLHGFKADDYCETATPLRLPWRVTGILADYSFVLFAGEGESHVVTEEDSFTLPFEVCACEPFHLQYQNPAGQWFERKVTKGSAEVVECEAPERVQLVDPVVLVDLEPWSE
ncbi:hypothetical protein J8273_8868 [Carpediemonas membranifera]|uniref:Uncharacterized protein n=1 Tax=Carpediemonas membranifera TaxID=201153 RepID=A0A8J6E6H8_9EUKA|nr:hypothetical protein J8273_8868 [Carpediemonas membranifera]|eukprot:KAG9389575.1 hypothetical protein J8273_8868 [Carpediemonas membranifera]